MGFLEGLWHALRSLWKVLKASWNLCKTFWGVWMAQKGIFWRFGSPLRRILEPFGASRSALGASWTRLGVLLARSWEHLRGFWKVFGCHFRAWNASLKRFAELLKNHQKHCKVLQKSGFGRSEIEEKIRLERTLEPNLMLSWLARLNFEVKIAKSTPFGWVRGTKWALGGPLERQSGPQERPKRVRVTLGVLLPP